MPQEQYQQQHCQQEDAVQPIITQWQNQGFGADELQPMETIGRIKRLEVLLMHHLSAKYKANYQLSHWEFDVLATLRRAGTPTLSAKPNDLI